MLIFGSKIDVLFSFIVSTSRALSSICPSRHSLQGTSKCQQSLTCTNADTPEKLFQKDWVGSTWQSPQPFDWLQDQVTVAQRMAIDPVLKCLTSHILSVFSCIHSVYSHVFCCSVTELSSALWDPMDCSTPGFPVLHYLLELAQTHVHWVSDATQPSHPLSPRSPPAFNLS